MPKVSGPANRSGQLFAAGRQSVEQGSQLLPGRRVRIVGEPCLSPRLYLVNRFGRHPGLISRAGQELVSLYDATISSKIGLLSWNWVSLLVRKNE